MPDAWYDTSALSALLNTVKGANEVWLIQDYAVGDDRATCLTERVASAAITSGNFTGPVASGNNQKLTFDGIGGTATATSTKTNFHIALVDGTKVLAVTDETSDQAITNGNPVTFPAFDMYSNQPTLIP